MIRTETNSKHAQSSASYANLVIPALKDSRLLDANVTDEDLLSTTVSRSNLKIESDKILVIYKDSKVDYDCQRLGMSRDELRAYYERQGADTERIFASHKRQSEAQKLMLDLLPAGNMLSRTQLLRMCESDAFRNYLGRYQAVIAFGGDNHFQWVAEQISIAPEMLLLGVNSDPLTSSGKLLQAVAQDLPSTIQKLNEGHYQVEDWTTLKIQVGNQTLMNAFSEVFIGEKQRTAMSRSHLMLYNREGNLVTAFEDKSSGLIISTGAGASGWFQAAGGQLGKKLEIERGSEIALVLSTETFASRLDHEQTSSNPLAPLSPKEFILPRGAKLVVESLNDQEGIVACDSQRETSFPRDTSRSNSAVVSISDTPLKVIRAD